MVLVRQHLSLLHQKVTRLKDCKGHLLDVTEHAGESTANAAL
jgi:hypothetical protein